MKKAIALFAVAGLAAAAQAGEIETRFVVSQGGVEVGDVGNLEAGTYTITLQAQTFASDGLGIAALRGRVLNEDGQATSNGQDLRSVVGYNVGDEFSAATLQVFSLSGLPTGADLGQGAWDDFISFDVDFDGSSATFTYDGLPLQDLRVPGLIAVAWNQQPGGLPLFSATTRTAAVNGTSITLAPAPGALALIGLGGLVAGRRRR